MFHFCLYCFRPIRRHRLYGRFAIIAGLAAFLSVAIFLALLVATRWFAAFLRNVVKGGPDSFWILLLAIVGGVLAIAIGLMMRDSIPSVTIVDTGNDTIFFCFRNQLFRDYFAQLNGER